MADPPKPKGQPDDLAEVDRALSVLKGRHPEHERARREDEQNRTRRAAELDRAARIASGAERSRKIRILAIALPVVALVAFIGMLGRREMVRRGRVEKAAAPYVALGFAMVETSAPSTTGTLETNVDPGCLVAVSTDAAPIKITRAGTTTEGAGPTLFCTCGAERIGLASTVASDGGLVLLRADAALIGGSRAFPFAPFKPGSTLKTDDACNDASLDAWVDAKKYPHPPADDGWLTASPRRAALARAGFHVVASAAPTAPFAVVDLPKDSCMLATSAKETDHLGLRAKGGASLVADALGGLIRCAQTEASLLVTREGAGELVVLVAPAGSAGGLQGVRELALSSGVALGASVMPSVDRAWDAKQILLASQIPEATITTASTPDVPMDRDARVVALSFETPSALSPDTGEEVYSYCDPSLDAKAHESFCVFSGPQKWRAEGGEAVAGLARSKLPFWLYSMQHASDPLALKGLTQLFRLARHLGREGFAPTTLEAVTELPAGVEVLGRTGEDAVVAVGVAPMAPWVYTLSDADAWTLDDAPRVVPVKPLEKVTLTTSIKNLPPKGSRRTVVFRRVKK